ncbi:MAG: penicillin-binding protein 1C [Thermodesulfobacteriota bacterium]
MKNLFLLFIFVLLPNADVFALPSFKEVQQAYVKSDSLLLDRDGEVLHELRVDKNRRRLDWTPLRNVSSALQEAVIQAEDKRFYDHRGVDYRAISGALIKGLTQEGLRGASTVTMQLASLLDRELRPKKGRRSLWQKGKQILRAWEIERSWSKPETLEAYLNLITFRGELQGIAAASRGLFGKDPHGLGRSESLILASLIRSPNASFEEISQRALNLNRSMNWKINDHEIHSKARQVFLGSNFVWPEADLAPHVSRQLLKGKPAGSSVVSTLDHRIQRFALDRLRHHLISLKMQNVKDGAILIAENQTGNVLAYVSYSGEPSRSRFVDGVQAKRQAGSTLKPFLYALAYERRILTPASILDDTPLDIAVLGGIYQPRDYDSEFRGLVTSRIALASSLNVPAVRTLSLVGIEPFLSKLRQLGIQDLTESGDFYGPSLALGSVDVSLWELVNAYRTLANGGTRAELHLRPGGNIPPKPKRIFSKEAAFLISDILSDREARSFTFGLENPLSTRFWTAVKTGTSKDMRDNWCIGYSGKYTVGVWVGNFTGEPMWNVSGITGAAPIWIETMGWLHRDSMNGKRETPASLVRREIRLPLGADSHKEELFVQGTEPDSKDKEIGQFNQRIVYPPSGTVISLDPDIPAELQKVFFISQSERNSLRWVLNDHTINGVSPHLSWSPRVGIYILTLVDENDRMIDSVHFEVRGPSEDEKGMLGH